MTSAKPVSSADSNETGIGDLAGRTKDVGRSEDEHVIAVFKVKVHSCSALGVRHTVRRNGKAWCGGEGMAKRCDGVNKGVKKVEFSTISAEGRCPLPDGNLNVAKANVSEDNMLDVFGNCLRHLESNGPRIHADVHYERIVRAFFPSNGHPEAGNYSDIDVARLEVGMGSLEKPNPERHDGVIVDGAHLASVGWSFETKVGMEPVSTSLVNAGCSARGPIEVGEGWLVVFGEARTVGVCLCTHRLIQRYSKQGLPAHVQEI
jgi:hypothetical protein